MSDMNREIKLRAWNSEDKKMVTMKGMKPNLSLENPECDLYNYLNSNTWEFMQFTGLKDKNGKEIWEGDILKCVRMIDYDVFAEPVNEVVTMVGAGYEPFTKNKMTPYRILPLYYSYEVVGNINENPELMKGEKV